MPASVDYVTRETASNLWRNRLMTIAAVLTVAVSLSLVGAAMLLRQGASHASAQWERGTQVTVWMNADASTAEVHAVGVELAPLPLVDHPCVWRDHEYDYLEALQLDPQVIQESGLKPSAIPTSWRCTPSQPADAAVVISRFSGQPGVRNVTAPLKTIHAEQVVITWLTWAFLALALVLLGSAIVLILNTIRMAIFARRREVSVMKLVGATNWFIRVPFMSEGLVEGILGSATAAALVYGLHALLDNFAHPGNVLASIELSGWDVFVIDVVVVLIGAAVGTFGSFVAIRRFLDV